MSCECLEQSSFLDGLIGMAIVGGAAAVGVGAVIGMVAAKLAK